MFLRHFNRTGQQSEDVGHVHCAHWYYISLDQKKQHKKVPEKDQTEVKDNNARPAQIVAEPLQHFNVTVKCLFNSCHSPLIQLHGPSLYNASPSCCVCACACACVFLAQSVIQSGLACCERQHCCRGTDVETRTREEADAARNSRSQRDRPSSLLTSGLIPSITGLFRRKNCARLKTK